MLKRSQAPTRQNPSRSRKIFHTASRAHSRPIHTLSRSCPPQIRSNSFPHSSPLSTTKSTRQFVPISRTSNLSFSTMSSESQPFTTPPRSDQLQSDQETSKKQQKQTQKQQKQQQAQQNQPKKPAVNKKDFTSVFNHTFPEGTFEYVDTHCHIDAILNRLNRTGRGAATSSSETGGQSCCGGDKVPASVQQPAEVEKKTEPETTTTTTTDPSSPVETGEKKEPEWTVQRMNKELHLGNWGGCVTVCCEPESYDDVLAVLDADDSGKIRGAFGVHPHEAKKWNQAVEDKFSKVMENPKVIAWGECGLDYYYSFSDHDVQKQVFIRQIELAVKYNKPLVVHTRDAEQDTVDIMLKHCPKDWKVHIHCCTSSVNMVKPLLANFPNLHVGFTGVVTFKNVDEIIETVKSVPLNRLLLETDGPYMAPMPFRGAVAHSGMIPFTAAKLAEIKEVSLEELMKQVRTNTKNVYGF